MAFPAPHPVKWRRVHRTGDEERHLLEQKDPWSLVMFLRTCDEFGLQKELLIRTLESGPWMLGGQLFSFMEFRSFRP